MKNEKIEVHGLEANKKINKKVKELGIENVSCETKNISNSIQPIK